MTKENAQTVGAHLVMVGRLIDEDPQTAYLHAQAAVRRGGRVDVVREAAGLVAYRIGQYAEALRELRTVRRLSGSPEHLATMADCERGLGRPDRAIALGQDPQVSALSVPAAVELAIVLSGARLDMHQPEAALAMLDAPALAHLTGGLAERVAIARSQALEALGRHEEAAAMAQSPGASVATEDEHEVTVFDLDEDEADVNEDLS